jgi:hypothetical protein
LWLDHIIGSAYNKMVCVKSRHIINNGLTKEKSVVRQTEAVFGLDHSNGEAAYIPKILVSNLTKYIWENIHHATT